MSETPRFPYTPPGNKLGRQFREDWKQNLKDIEHDIKLLNRSQLDALEAAEYAQGRGDYANEKGQYADVQGSFAKDQGEYANSEASNLETLKNDVTQATQDATSAANNANTEASNLETLKGEASQATQAAHNAASNADVKAQYASEQGDYAKDQGARAEDAADEVAGIVGDIVKSVNGQKGEVILEAEDVGAETVQGAQTKADKAKQNSKEYTDQKADALDERINDIEQQYSKSVGYGVRWNYVSDTYERIGKARGLNPSDFDNIYPWSAIRRCVVDDSGNVVAYHGEPGYVEDGSAGQVMVEYPDHYFKRIVNHPYIEFWINGEYAAGFELQKTFKRGNQTTDKIYLGAFDGSIFDVSAGEYLYNDEQIADFTAGSGDLLSSIAGVKPASGDTQQLTIGNARNIANNRGVNWGQLDFDTHSMVQNLLLIEYANFNSQAEIGNGVVSKASGTGNESELTGATSFLGNASGMAPGSNGQVPISYRGLENFWGNIYKWMDGLNIKDKVAFFNTTGIDFESDKFDGHYEHVGFEMYQGDSSTYPIMVGSSESLHHGFLGTEGGGTSSSYLTDRLYIQNMGRRVARVGGYWVHGLNAGAFILDLNTSSAYRNRNIGARLLCAKVPLKST